MSTFNYLEFSPGNRQYFCIIEYVKVNMNVALRARYPVGKNHESIISLWLKLRLQHDPFKFWDFVTVFYLLVL